MKWARQMTPFHHVYKGTVLFVAPYFLKNRILDMEATHVSVRYMELMFASFSGIQMRTISITNLFPHFARPFHTSYLTSFLTFWSVTPVAFGGIYRSYLTCFTLETRRDRKKVVEEIQPGNDYVFQQAMHMYSTYREFEKYCPFRRLRKFSGLFMLELIRKANINISVQPFSIFLHI